MAVEIHDSLQKRLVSRENTAVEAVPVATFQFRIQLCILIACVTPRCLGGESKLF